MQIKTDDYTIAYNPTDKTVAFKGALRLSSFDDYTPILTLLNEAVVLSPVSLTLDLRNLEFLNSSGINVLSKFVIKVQREHQKSLVVQGSQQIPWQGKSLRNLQRLMPGLQLEIV